VASAEKEAPFLRRGGVVVRRRKKPVTGRLVAVGLLSLAAATGLVRYLGGERFALRRFDVRGNSRARTEEILGAMAEWNGRNLVALDLAPMAGRLAEHPWIERVTLSKRFALFREDQHFWFVDSRGNLIAPYDPRMDRGEYVIVSGERRALPDAVGLLEDLRTAVPDYCSALSEIASLPDGGFGMMDAIFRMPVRVVRGDAPAKIRALLGARGFIESRGWEARAIDLRFADQILLAGAYGAGHSL
jgi:cell division septal protein FtsQ